ncbi:G-protein coupled receptor 39 isoform X1 [Sus scrofa]|uniref:G protein-coupled receptor 39 n=2 Tax=Sus scrofa TaxID=9823 RepID=A0A4X1SQY0_PIG|nr:G-protein coupled receptor 39 isoform X1 [Sus scrofa]XP_020930215.1 G-protein coupled receptor 39 isoform X1 [Sus scrofa]XP_020930216.1 G-protein coupled receptor 39 isoform X1 [Sus scrofa]
MASPSRPGNDCSHVIDHSHVPEFEVATWIKITLILLFLVIFVVGILGNSVTIRVTQVLQKKGYLQKEVTDHMVSLACSDILVFLIGMPVEFYSIIWNPLTTPSYTVSCKLHSFLFETCSYATLLHVLTLSFERYIAICHPFRYKAMSGPCQVKLLIGFVWVTSALVALPLLFAMGVEYPLVDVPSHRGLSCNRSRNHHSEHPETSNMSVCTNLSSRWTVFQSSIFGAFIIYLVVLVSVAFMCWSMMQALQRSKQGTLAAKGQQLQLRKSESEESRSARRQTIIFLRLIVVTLAICWMPNQIRRMMAAAKPKQDWTKAYFKAYMILLPFSDTFFYLSSVVNPLLYNVSSQQFRSVFAQVLRCRLTLPHANQDKRLRAQAASTMDSARSVHRPLIFLASRSNSSARRTDKVFLSTSQSESEAKPQSKPQLLNHESPESDSVMKPANPATENGIQEHEV